MPVTSPSRCCATGSRPSSPNPTREQLQADGLYALLRARGVRPAVARQTIGARNAKGEDRRLLRLTKAEPLLAAHHAGHAPATPQR